MDLTEEQVLAPLLMAAEQSLATLGVPACEVAHDATCEEVENLFRRDGTLSAVVVCGPDGDLGLMSRTALNDVMAGRLGFGSLLNRRQPVGQFASWAPLVFEAEDTLVAAAARILLREHAQWDDVLVQTPGGLRVVGSASVLQGMTGAFAARATHDTLTSLPNRPLFLGRLARACGAAGQTRRGALVVLYIDLDDFKKVNDTHGHSAGDALLISTADAMRAVARADDLVARLGGDEFAVMFWLPEGMHDPVTQAASVAERYRSALSATSPASVGVAVSHDGVDAESLLRDADTAMYTAKSAGGNRVVVVDQAGEHLTMSCDGGLHADHDSSTRQALLQALEADQFILHYQPIIRLADFTVASVEALVRWNHPSRGLLSPGEFLDDAARLGLAAELDAWVLHRALADLTTFETDGSPAYPGCLNVNISRATLLRDDLFDLIAHALAAHGVPAGRLRLELVEDAATDVLVAAAPQLAALRRHGVSLTWDDMGTGASSLKHVTHIDVDGLKIDKSFIQEMATSASALAVVRMLVHLGEVLGVAVTAEGIETAEQRDTLVQLGAEFGQGFLLARPSTVDALRLLLAQQPLASVPGTGECLAS